MAKKKAKKNGPIKWLKSKRLAALKKKRLAEMVKGNPGGWNVQSYAPTMAEARALAREMKRFERVHKRGEQWKAGKVGGRPALLVKAKKNPGKLRKVTGTSGWLKADAVRFVKKGGRTEVYIRRDKKRRRK